MMANGNVKGELDRKRASRSGTSERRRRSIVRRGASERVQDEEVEKRGREGIIMDISQ
jgi:hypothetical protein